MSQTERILHDLADLTPRPLAVAHGSSFVGDGARALRDLHQALWETFGSRTTPERGQRPRAEEIV
jgi:hypothetical protein